MPRNVRTPSARATAGPRGAGVTAAPGRFVPTMKELYHDPVDGPILDHPGMRNYLRQARRAHKRPGLQVWTGVPGVGKTITRRVLVRECEAEMEAALATGHRSVESGVGAPRAPYRALDFTTGGDVDRESQRQMKRGLYAAYEFVVGELSVRDQRGYTERMLATDIVEELRLLDAQMLLIDEAGTKTSAEIRGLALISDVGRDLGWPVTVIVVGMDDLAHKAGDLPVLESRIRLTLVFQPWRPAECREWILTRSAALRDRIEGGGPTAADAEAAITSLVDAKGGRLREIETLLPEVDGRLTRWPATKAVADALSAQTLAGTDAAQQADAYLERLRLRRMRRR